MKLQCAVRGDVKTMNTLSHWAVRAGNSEPAMLEISAFIEERNKVLFESEGKSAGRPWAPNKGSTTDTRKRKGESTDKILHASGDLERSLTDSNDKNAIRQIASGFIRFGTKLKYAEPQRTGFKDRGHERIAARRPIDLTIAERRAITRILGGWITGHVRKGAKPSLRFLR